MQVIKQCARQFRVVCDVHNFFYPIKGCHHATYYLLCHWCRSWCCPMVPCSSSMPAPITSQAIAGSKLLGHQPSLQSKEEEILSVVASLCTFSLSAQSQAVPHKQAEGCRRAAFASLHHLYPSLIEGTLKCKVKLAHIGRLECHEYKYTVALTAAAVAYLDRKCQKCENRYRCPTHLRHTIPPKFLIGYALYTDLLYMSVFHKDQRVQLYLSCNFSFLIIAKIMTI